MTVEIETEDQLVARAQQALSSCNWEIGECAAQWTKKYARGRTDADFGTMIGLSGDQVYQRRRVWETFADVHENYPQLKWSHFYVAINWDDAAECLHWANEIEATVSEMKAWRRAQHGEDLSAPAEEQPPFDLAGDYLSVGTGMVRDPDDFGTERDYSGSGTAMLLGEGDERPETAMAAARESNSDYAPFGKGARGAAPGEHSEREAPSTEQIVRRACAALEKVVVALTPAVLEEFHDLPLDLQQRLINAADNLQSRIGGFS